MKNVLLAIALILSFLAVSFAGGGKIDGAAPTAGIDGNPDFLTGYNNPVFSPDSKKSLFAGSDYNGVYYYDFDSGTMNQISAGKSSGYKYYWSKDGMFAGFKLLIEAKPDEFLQVPVIYNVNTGKSRSLSAPVHICGIPSFADNGDIAFSVDNEITVMNDKLQVIHKIAIPEYANVTPISPDAKRVAFNDRDDQIWVVNVDGSGLRKVTDGETGCFMPVWSPDGTKLLMNTINGKIKVVVLDTGNAYEIDTGDNPRWLNDSASIVYTTKSFNTYVLTKTAIMMAAYNGTGKQQVSPEEEKFAGDCTVSPDGKKVLYKDYFTGKFYTAPLVTYNTVIQQGSGIIGAGKVSIGTQKQELLLDTQKKTALIDGNVKDEFQPIINNSTVLTANLAYQKMTGIPYVHQVYDSPNWFAGNWACGATSSIMVIGYYKIVNYWDCTCSSPYSHTSHYGRYICEKYTFNGVTYSWASKDPDGVTAYGGYGFITKNNWADTKGGIRDYLKNHKLSTSVTDWSPTWAELVSEIKAKRPFVLLNMLTSSGHYITTIGYSDSSRAAVFNDPYGNKNSGYMNYSGAGAIYDWPGYNNGHSNLNTVSCVIYGRGYTAATAPAAPSTFSVDYNESGYGTVMKWSAVSGATAYKVGRRPSGGTWTYWDNITTANATDITWPGMYHTHGAGKFDFAVQAKNSVGASAWKYINAVVSPDQSIPATPAGLIATSVSPSQIKLTWTAVSGASGYTIYCSSTKAELEDKCYKKTPTGDGGTWAGLAYATDGDRGNTNYASISDAAAASIWVTLSPAQEIHKYSFRFYDADNRIYENVYARWYDTAGAYHNPHGWRAYRTGGAYRLSATADVKCTKLGVSFGANAGNTSNGANHVTVMEAHGGYLTKTTGTTYTASSLKSGTAYYFRIDAYKSVSPETLSYSTVIVATNTLGSADTTAPAVPALVSPANAASLNTSVPVFDWSDVTDASGVKYKLQADNDSDFSSPVINQAALTASTYSPTAGLANGTYYWRVCAVDGAGNTSTWSAARSVALNVTGTDTIPPMNPTGIQAWANDTKATVVANDTWQKVDAGPYFEWTGASDAGTGVSGYTVYWGTNSVGDPGNIQTIVEQAPVKYFAVPATAEKPYYLRVKTRDNAGNWSAAVTLFTLKYDNIPPLVPNLVYPANATLFTVNKVSFTCSAVNDPSGCTYMLQVDNAYGFTSPEVNVPNLTTADIVNTKYEPSYTFTEGTYFWRVGTKDGVGNTGNWSTPRSFYIDTAGPQPITTLTAALESGGDIKLSWTSARDTVGQISSYKIYRSEVSTSIGTQINAGEENGVAEYIDAGTGLIENGVYYYVVMPVDNLGNVTQTGNNQVSITCKKVGVSLSGITAVPPVFSPNNDGLKDAVTIYYTLSPAGKVSMKVYDQDNTVVRTIIDKQSRPLGKNSEVWAGIDDTNQFIIDSSKYYVRITAVDAEGNESSPRDVDVEIDITPPEISSYTLTNSAISPNNDGAYDSTIIMYALSEPAKITMTVKNESGTTVKTITSNSRRNAGRTSETWDGRNDNNEVVSDGKYKAFLYAEDDCGNVCEEEEVEIVVDAASGWILGYVYNETTGYGNIAENRIGNAELTLNTGLTASSSADTEKKGLYGFYSLTEGEYEIAAYAKGYQSKNITVTVEAGKIKWNSIGLVYVGKTDNESPTVEHTPYSYIGLVGTKLRITAGIEDNVIIDTAKVVYKLLYTNGTESEEEERTMIGVDSMYYVDIPADEIVNTVALIKYQIFAYDGDENETVSPKSGQYHEVIHRSLIEKTVLPTGGRVVIADGNPEDGEVEVKLPSGLSSSNINVRMMQKEVTSVPAVKSSQLITTGISLPIAAYEIDTDVKTLTIPADITLLYFDVDDDGIVDGTDIDETRLQVYWHDSNDWRYVGGVVNTAKNTLTVKVSHFSLFGIFPSASLSSIDAEQFKPKEKIITPNSDGSNDFACFNGIHNYWQALSLADSTQEMSWVKIFDVQNRMVRTIESIDIWDGRNTNGEFVENGIYIYQFVINGKTVTGSIVIAK
ncbi:MAG: FlgD immunoglobulin-like domain containing protein [Elusimicrobiota bacterium]